MLTLLELHLRTTIEPPGRVVAEILIEIRHRISSDRTSSWAVGHRCNRRQTNFEKIFLIAFIIVVFDIILETNKAMERYLLEKAVYFSFFLN